MGAPFDAEHRAQLILDRAMALHREITLIYPDAFTRPYGYYDFMQALEAFIKFRVEVEEEQVESISGLIPSSTNPFSGAAAKLTDRPGSPVRGVAPSDTISSVE